MVFLTKHNTFLASSFIAVLLCQTQTFSMESQLAAAALASPTPQLAAITLPAPAKAAEIDTYTAALERAQVVGDLFVALAREDNDSFMQFYAVAQQADTEARNPLVPGLNDNPESQFHKDAFEKLQLYASTQLHVLTIDRFMDLLKKYVQNPRLQFIEEYIGEKLETHNEEMSQTQLDLNAASYALYAERLPKVRKLDNRFRFLPIFYSAYLEDLNDITRSSSYAEYLEEGGKHQPTHFEKIIIDKSFEHPLLRKVADLENNRPFKQGAEMGPLLMNRLKTWLKAKAAEQTSDEIEKRIAEAAQLPLNDALAFFKGFQLSLDVLNIESYTEKTDDAARVRICTGMFNMWKDFIGTLVHAQTKKQLIYCIIQSADTFSIV